MYFRRVLNIFLGKCFSMKNGLKELEPVSKLLSLLSSYKQKLFEILGIYYLEHNIAYLFFNIKKSSSNDD